MTAFSPPRPRWMTPEIARAAARAIAEDLVEAGHAEAAERDALARDLERVACPHMDGYRLATLLEQDGWECNLEMAETLDGFSTQVADFIAAAETAWAATVDLTPPLAPGTRVRINAHESGVLDGVYEHGPGKYLVRLDEPDTGASRGLRIVNFEDVVRLGDTERASGPGP